MANQVVADTFETLGKTAGQVVKQVVQEPDKVVETASAQVGTKPTESGVEEPQSQAPTPQQLAAKKAASQRQLSNLENELKVLRQKREQELSQRRAPVQEQPSEGKQIRQLGFQKDNKENKEELPPPVTAAKKKGSERKTGVSG